LPGRPSQRRDRWLLVAGARGFVACSRRLSRFDADNLRFDQDVIWAADHDEMFDIVAPHEDKLTLSVEVKGIDNPEARLTRPAAARHVQPAAESQPKNEQNQESRNKECDSAR
jgi:hypothetical protein